MIAEEDQGSGTTHRTTGAGNSQWAAMLVAPKVSHIELVWPLNLTSNNYMKTGIKRTDLKVILTWKQPKHKSHVQTANETEQWGLLTYQLKEIQHGLIVQKELASIQPKLDMNLLVQMHRWPGSGWAAGSGLTVGSRDRVGQQRFRLRLHWWRRARMAGDGRSLVIPHRRQIKRSRGGGFDGVDFLFFLLYLGWIKEGIFLFLLFLSGWRWSMVSQPKNTKCTSD
jgi:hypothetical protein